MTVREVPNIVAQTKDGDFQASMRSINTLVTGDPYFLLKAMLSEGGRTNSGHYVNPRAEQLLDQLQVETRPARRQALSRQVQRIQAVDVPNALLMFTPIIIVLRKGKLSGFVADPNNEYLLNGSLDAA